MVTASFFVLMAARGTAIAQQEMPPALPPAIPNLDEPSLPPAPPSLPPEIDDQVPVPEPEPSPETESEDAPEPEPEPTPQPTSAPTMRELVDALAETEVQSIVSLLRSSYIHSERLDDAGLARSQLHGLLLREDPGIQLLPPGAPQDVRSGAFASATIDGIGYVRPGALNGVMLERLDEALSSFTDDGVATAILDLRACGASGDANLAAAVLRRFRPPGAPLFTIRSHADAGEDKLYTGNREPLFSGRIIALTDSDVRGPSEIIAGVLAQQANALLVGSPTAGQLMESADIVLNGGRVLRYAIGAVEIEGLKTEPGRGLVPAVPVDMDVERKWDVYAIADKNGIEDTVMEVERPRMNEAALVAGRNPELAQLEEIGESGRLSPARERVFDAVLKSGLDAAISLQVLAP